jgi:hypothetical protein
MHMKIKNLMRSLRPSLASIFGDKSGLAMTEFALALPILVTLGLTGSETANLALANLKVSQIALMVADNAGRVRNSIDETDIDEVMIGARLAGQGIKFGSNGRIILSSLEPNGQTGLNAGQMIRWQRCFGSKTVTSSYGAEGDGTTDATLAAGMGPIGRKIQSSSNSAVMVVEVVYDYQPVVSNTIFGAQTIRDTVAFTVRERSVQTMTNTAGLTNAQKRLCSRYSAT